MARAAAFFDVDGTLTRSDIFRDHVRFRREVRGGAATTAWMLTAPLRGAWLLALDRLSREHGNRAVYGCYRGFDPGELAAWAESFQERHGLARSHARGLDLLRRHHEAGHRIVFVTGSLREIVAPFARRLEEHLGLGESIRVEAAALEEGSGAFTGRLAGAPVSGLEKASRARRVAEEESLDLARSHAYGDSMADLPLLETVGRPAAVNPEARLRRLARARGWPVLELERRH
jgi:HAD superfamily hydrolase (TIGR01490 family)